MNPRAPSSAPAAAPTAAVDDRTLRQLVSAHARPSWGQAMRQLADSVLPFTILMVASFALWSWHWSASLGLAAIAGLVAVRIFILFHDCTHHAWLPSRRANIGFGRCLGILLFTPYDQWRHEHSLHHAGSGDLDRRGHGDIDTLTVDEYRSRSFWGRLAYRLYRNPLIMFGVGPLYIFVIKQRFTRRGAPISERLNGYATNLVLVLGLGALILSQGLVPTVVILLGMLGTALTVGVWLFYVQHQYEDGYWRQRPEWNVADAALCGSSFYDLPAPLHWLTGNIGFHHLHHLNARVPNYHLQACHRSLPPLPQVAVLTLRSSLSSLRLRLWDGARGRMITWRELRAMGHAPAEPGTGTRARRMADPALG